MIETLIIDAVNQLVTFDGVSVPGLVGAIVEPISGDGPSHVELKFAATEIVILGNGAKAQAPASDVSLIGESSPVRSAADVLAMEEWLAKAERSHTADGVRLIGMEAKDAGAPEHVMAAIREVWARRKQDEDAEAGQAR